MHFVEDYCLLGKRETIERADVEAVVADLKARILPHMCAVFRGYDASGTGEVSNVADMVG